MLNLILLFVAPTIIAIVSIGCMLYLMASMVVWLLKGEKS